VQFPRLLKRIREEHSSCLRVVNDFRPDLIISDHCYGIYHPGIPSYFISHQISFAMPGGLAALGPLAARMNRHFHEKFDKIIIPDFRDAGRGLLSGNLSRLPAEDKKYVFGGILSSINRQAINEPLDLLVSISGPEPQRTIFEKKILQQIESVPGEKVVALGKSETTKLVHNSAGLQVYSHIPRREMTRLFNCAGLIVSRPGYSTLMELAELGKQALLIPTPGQTEQMSLARHALQKNWFFSVSQNKLNLARDIEIAREYAGLFKPNVSAWSVGNIFDNILNLK